ncbi:MAG TPA: DUF4147 domain-containing protein [bacterium]|nr:DUF4147 domain-containing protein [bacterium]
MIYFRSTAETILLSILASVAPESMVRRHVRIAAEKLLIDHQEVDFYGRKLVCLGAGKASARMAQALAHIIERGYDAGSLTSPDGYVVGAPGCVARAAGHPLPDKRSVIAASEALDIAQVWSKRDPLVFGMISGGTSALWCVPREGVTLEQKIETGNWLLASGLPINKINTIRRRLSAIKGGQLARALNGVEAHILVLSDVPDDTRLDIVGSGPFYPDSSSNEEALSYLTEAELPPPAWLADLIRTAPALPDSSTFANVHHYQIGSNRDAVVAAALKAAENGLHPIIQDEPLVGEAREVGIKLARQVMGADVHRPTCWIYGGETTVTLSDNPGRGGRNQEMALAFAIEAAGKENVALLAFSTDGVDGMSDAAGAYVHGATMNRIHEAQMDACDYLERNDSYTALSAAGALLYTGPTGTNVADVAVVITK